MSDVEPLTYETVNVTASSAAFHAATPHSFTQTALIAALTALFAAFAAMA